MVPSILRCIPPPREEASRLEPDDGGRPPWPGICGSLRFGEPVGVAVAERELPRGYMEPPLGGNWPLLLEKTKENLKAWSLLSNVFKNVIFKMQSFSGSSLMKSASDYFF